jgi:hypothetical protein
MRIFVSSSFEDLREHRAAVIRVLRQLVHEVLAMEDLAAASAAPLAKVLDMVDRSEAYVGLFAWRYGYVPGAYADPVTRQQPTAPGPQPPAILTSRLLLADVHSSHKQRVWGEVVPLDLI